MTGMIVLCHPFERSLCHSFADASHLALVESGAEPIRHDLYAQAFDPVLSGAEIARGCPIDPLIQEACRQVTESELLIFVHPDWWSGPPALLKGWIERVFRPGVAYDWEGPEFEEKRHVPLLTSKRLIALVTTDRTEDDPPAPLPAFWRDVAAYSGMTVAGIRLFHDVRHSGHRERRRWIAEATTLVSEHAQGGTS